MDEIYKVASTERIQMLEKELAVRLTELKSTQKSRGLFWEQLIELTAQCRCPRTFLSTGEKESWP